MSSWLGKGFLELTLDLAVDFESDLAWSAKEAIELHSMKHDIYSLNHFHEERMLYLMNESWSRI